MFKILLSFLLTVPLWGQQIAPIGSRANTAAELCSNLGQAAEECISVNTDNTFDWVTSGSGDDSGVTLGNADKSIFIGVRGSDADRMKIEYDGTEVVQSDGTFWNPRPTSHYTMTAGGGDRLRADSNGVEIQIRTDGTCDGGLSNGNICTDDPNSPSITADTCSGGTPTVINPVLFTRVGNIVTVSGQMNLPGSTGCDVGNTITMNLPVSRTSGSFSNTEQASGNFSSKADGGHGTVESVNSSQTILLTFGAQGIGGRIGFVYMYSMTN